MSANSSKDLGAWMEERRQELGLQWREVAEASERTMQALRDLRSGRARRPTRTTRSAIERALRWEAGSVDRILHGGEPASLEPPIDQVTAPTKPDMEGLLAQIALIRREFGDDVARAFIEGAFARPAEVDHPLERKTGDGQEAG